MLGVIGGKLMRTGNFKVFILVSAPIAFWFLSMYPAVLTPDSFSVLGYVNSKEFNSFHTLTYLLFVRILSFGGKAFFLVSLFQLVLNYFALYLSVRFFFRNHIPNIRIVLVTSLLFFTPFFGPISATIWKDNPFNAFTVIGLILLAENFLIRNEIRQTNRTILSFSLLTIGSTFRHDGLWTLLIFGTVLFLIGLFSFKKNRKGTLLIASCLLAASLFSLFISAVLSNILNSEPVPRYQKTLSFLLDLQYVNANFPEMLKPQIKVVLDEISSGPSLKGAKSCSNTYNFWNPGFNQTAANQHVYEIPKFWLQSMDSNARDSILKARFCRTSAINPWPISRIPDHGYWPTIGISPNNENINHPIWAYPLYLIGYVWVYLWGINGNVIAWPGLHLTITFLVLLNLLSRKKITLPVFRASMFIILYFFCRSGILFLSTASQEFRYLSGIYFLSTPVFIFSVYSFIAKFIPKRWKIRTNV